jgi:hypothetical protein
MKSMNKKKMEALRTTERITQQRELNPDSHIFKIPDEISRTTKEKIIDVIATCL